MNEETNPLTGLPFSNEEISELSQLCQIQLDTEDKVKELELQLKAEKEKLRDIREDQIPTLMNQLGVSELKTDDGFKVSVKPFYAASIPKNPSIQAKFFAWLEDNNHDGIIKTEVKARFMKGEMETAKQALDLILQVAPGASLDRNVHPMTLKSFVREQIESGNALPTDLINVHIGNVSTIKR